MGLWDFTDRGVRSGDSGKWVSPSASKQPCSACQAGQMVKSADRPSFFKYSPKNCDSALMEILSPGGGIGPRDQLLYKSVFAKKSNVSSVITRKLLNTRVDRGSVLPSRCLAIAALSSLSGRARSIPIQGGWKGARNELAYQEDLSL